MGINLGPSLEEVVQEVQEEMSERSWGHVEDRGMEGVEARRLAFSDPADVVVQLGSRESSSEAEVGSMGYSPPLEGSVDDGVIGPEVGVWRADQSRRPTAVPAEGVNLGALV